MSGTATPVVRKDAPRPADMVSLFPTLERASRLFVEGRYAEVLPLLKTILAGDPHNLDAALRLATSYSMLDQTPQALAAFRHAASLAPRSPDARPYLALHYARGKDRPRAVPLLEQAVRESPDRLAALEGLAAMREKQGRLAEAVQLRQKVLGLRPPAAGELVSLGQLAMEAGETDVAIDAFTGARTVQGPALPPRPRARRSVSRRRDGCPRRVTPSTGFPLHTRPIRWPSSSARRSACC